MEDYLNYKHSILDQNNGALVHAIGSGLHKIENAIKLYKMGKLSLSVMEKIAKEGTDQINEALKYHTVKTWDYYFCKGYSKF